MQMNLPNVLTLLRMIAAPFVALVFVLFERPVADVMAFVLFVGAAVTDYFDGYLARRWGQITQFGRVLDPIADKAMVTIGLAILWAIFGLDPLLIIPATVIFLREVMVAGLREALGDAAVTLKVTKLAKWKTTFQMAAIGALLFGGITDPRIAAIDMLGFVLLWIAAVMTAITGWDYTIKAAEVLKGRS